MKLLIATIFLFSSALALAEPTPSPTPEAPLVIEPINPTPEQVDVMIGCDPVLKTCIA